MSAKLTQYTDRRGITHPILELSRVVGDKYPLSFGLSKAKLILDNLDNIRAFVGAFEQSAAPSIEVKPLDQAAH
jgi:hypothetical protein